MISKKRAVDAFMDIACDQKFITKKGLVKIKDFVEIIYSAGYDNGYHNAQKNMRKEAKEILEKHLGNV